MPLQLRRVLQLGNPPTKAALDLRLRPSWVAEQELQEVGVRNAQQDPLGQVLEKRFRRELLESNLGEAVQLLRQLFL